MTGARLADRLAGRGALGGSSPDRFAHAAPRIVTMDPAHAKSDDPLTVQMEAAILVEGGRVAWIGPQRELPEGVPCQFHPDAVITPGLVDAHTHACWVGSRHEEYVIRMAGGDYEAIAAAGGGILSTQRAVAAATEDELASALRARLLRMARLGVTCVEVKSGYGLVPEQEWKQLRAIARVAKDESLPRVVPTFLALHALPPEHATEREAYVDRVASELVPRFAEAGLCEFVDAYVDQNAFRVGEARRVGEAARAAGLGLRLHIGQFADVGGAELAAELGASSADHLEHLTPAGALALAHAGTHAVLLPVAGFTLRQAPPPIEALRAAHVPIVVASDANPGTAPTESLLLALAMAVRSYGLTPTEGLLGITRTAASSLRLFGARPTEIRGALVPGARADLVVWDHGHEHALAQPWGTSRARLVLRDGLVIAEG
jgi:imidazolonepropionase